MLVKFQLFNEDLAGPSTTVEMEEDVVAQARIWAAGQINHPWDYIQITKENEGRMSQWSWVFANT